MATVPTKPPAAKLKDKPPPRDALREVIETVVFVVALVLMLKLFVVEAFVIPTGSMAETLYGYQKIVTCPSCEYEFPVNSSNEVDPADGLRRPVTGACCPNCRVCFPMDKAGNPPNRSGDRVLVHKAVYELGAPDRGHVVVFKFPVDPQVQHTAQNYIKRLWGLGDETIAIHRGDLFVARGLPYPPEAVDSIGQPKYPRPKPEEMDRLWEGPDVDRHSKTRPPYRSLGLDFTYHNADVALQAFEDSYRTGFPGGAGRFELIRKPDGLALSMRRIVYHNDFQSEFLAKKGVPPRWTAHGDGWKADRPSLPRVFTHSGESLGWIRYLHRVPSQEDQTRMDRTSVEELFAPSSITNFLGYNAGLEDGIGSRMTGDYWVSDLMVECTAKLSAPSDEVVMELAKGVHRFQARFANGKVSLWRLGPGEKQLAEQSTSLTRAGTYRLRFANFDCRLRVWVDDDAIDFGPAADYSPTEGVGLGVGAVASAVFAPRADGHTLQNDILAPASLGARGGVGLSEIVLWQDTYFTPADGGPAESVDTFYVQPGHYFCLGDNSGQSSDSRKWGLVPERLLLGRAVFIFFPFDRIGFIR